MGLILQVDILSAASVVECECTSTVLQIRGLVLRTDNFTLTLYFSDRSSLLLLYRLSRLYMIFRAYLQFRDCQHTVINMEVTELAASS